MSIIRAVEFFLCLFMHRFYEQTHVKRWMRIPVHEGGHINACLTRCCSLLDESVRQRYRWIWPHAFFANVAERARGALKYILHRSEKSEPSPASKSSKKKSSRSGRSNNDKPLNSSAHAFPVSSLLILPESSVNEVSACLQIGNGENREAVSFVGRAPQQLGAGQESLLPNPPAERVAGGNDTCNYCSRRFVDQEDQNPAVLG